MKGTEIREKKRSEIRAGFRAAILARGGECDEPNESGAMRFRIACGERRLAGNFYFSKYHSQSTAYNLWFQFPFFVEKSKISDYALTLGYLNACTTRGVYEMKPENGLCGYRMTNRIGSGKIAKEACDRTVSDALNMADKALADLERVAQGQWDPDTFVRNYKAY